MLQLGGNLSAGLRVAKAERAAGSNQRPLSSEDSLRPFLLMLSRLWPPGGSNEGVSGTALPQDGSHLSKHPPSSEGRQKWGQVLEDPESCCRVTGDPLGLTGRGCSRRSSISASAWPESRNLASLSQSELSTIHSFFLSFDFWQNPHEGQSALAMPRHTKETEQQVCGGGGGGGGGGIQRRVGRFGDANQSGKVHGY